MTVLVTGGAGFIGSNLVRALIADGANVIVVDDLSSGSRERLPVSSQLELVEADLADEPALTRLVRRCDVVFHLAAHVGTMPSLDDPVRDAEANVLGTVSLLAACRDASLRRIVVSSSAAVYGEARSELVDELEPVAPASFYALSKLSSERYAVLASRLLGLPTVVLRYFNVYGLPLVRGDYAGVIVAFMDRLARDEPLLIFGDGSQARDFVYVADVVAANLAAATRGAAGAVYNIGTGTATSILELAERMSALAGRPLRVEHAPARPGEVQRSVAAIGRARAELGYEPAYGLDAGLREVWSRAWPERAA